MLEEILPVHPRTGLTAIGVLPSGRPVWPVMGAADDDGDSSGSGDGGDGADGSGTDGGSDDRSDDDGGDPDGADQLGDAGKRALDAMKARARRAEEALALLGDNVSKSEIRRFLREREDLRREVAELRNGAGKDGKDGKDGGPDPEQVRREAEQAATAKANERIVRAEVKAEAAGKLADPADALRFLDLKQFEVDDDGNVDTDEIGDAIADLVKKKPYLAAQGGKRFQGSGDGGAHQNGQPRQVTREQLARMSPAERMKAHNEGRTADLLKKQG